MEILQEKCTNLQIQKQLKQNEMNFCKDIIYTTQNYDKDQYKKNIKDITHKIIRDIIKKDIFLENLQPENHI